MLCKNCGNSISSSDRFCGSCGAENPEFQEYTDTLNSEANLYNTEPQMETPYYEMEQPQTKKKKSKAPLIISLSAILVIIVAAALFLFLPSSPENINLNDYLAIEITGYDTQGNAELVFDAQQFTEDYGDILSRNLAYSYNSSPRPLQKISNLFSKSELDPQIGQKFFDDVIEFEFDKSENISNGDEINLFLTADQTKINQIWQANLVYEDIKTTAQGLYKATIIDVFEQIEVSFDGYNGQGIAGFRKNENYELPDDIIFTYSPEENLQNGDIITVKIESLDGNVAESILEKLGAKLAQESKKYVVTGLEEDPEKITQATTAPTTEETTQATEPTVVTDKTENPTRSVTTNDYYYGNIFPYSSESLIDKSIIRGLKDWEIKDAINEIYARNGYIFKTPEILAYYRQFDWYYEVTPADSFNNSMFNQIEKENINRLAIERDSR